MATATANSGACYSLQLLITTRDTHYTDADGSEHHLPQKHNFVSILLIPFSGWYFIEN